RPPSTSTPTPSTPPPPNPPATCPSTLPATTSPPASHTDPHPERHGKGKTPDPDVGSGPFLCPERSHGAPGGIRTHTARCLRPRTLPIGLPGPDSPSPLEGRGATDANLPPWVRSWL